MNEAEAREILETFKVDDESTRATRSDSFLAGKAKGYLECFEQARPLVEAFKALMKRDGIDEFVKGEEALSQWTAIQIAKKALEDEAQK